jgi:hypothetical protein
VSSLLVEVVLTEFFVSLHPIIKEQKARVCSACYDYVTTQVAIVELVSSSRAHRKNMKKLYVEYRNSTNWMFDADARKKFGVELWYTSKPIDGVHWIRAKGELIGRL